MIRKPNPDESWQIFIIDFESHGLCDASIEAYSAMVYVRSWKDEFIENSA